MTDRLDDNVIVSFDVLPLYAQIEIGDSEAEEVPEFEAEEDLAVSNESLVCVATQPDDAGKVRLEVRSSAEGVSGTEVFAGDIALPSGVLVVGNTVASQTRDIDLSPADSVSVRILVEPRQLANRVTVILN